MKIISKTTKWAGKYLNFFHYYLDNGRVYEVCSRKQHPNPKECDAVSIIAFNEDQTKVCLIKEYRIPAEDYIWSFPAGLRDSDEEPEATAARELLEETGLIFKKTLTYLPPSYQSPGMTDENVATIFCIATGEPQAKGENTEEFIFKKVVDLFTLIGTASVIEEKYMDLSTALAGSGPAFFYAVADAFAKGCENLGLDEKTSLIMSAQTMLGAAKMLLNSGKTPETLIREVTTPNGCTAEGLKYMNENNVENLLAKTIEVTTQRAATLAQK